MRTYTHYYELMWDVSAPPEAVFERLDDPLEIGAHMARGSSMMMRGAISYELDARATRAVCAVIRLKAGFSAWSLPPQWPQRWQGRLFAGIYAQRCVSSIGDAVAIHYRTVAAGSSRPGHALDGREP